MKRVVLGLAAAVFLLGGCGGGDDDRLTEAEFKTQGNKICADGSAAIEAAGKARFGDQQPDQAALVAFAKEDVFPGIRKQIADIRALDEPKDIEDELNAALDDADEILDKAKPEDMLGDTNPFADVNTRMGKLGLTTCAED